VSEAPRLAELAQAELDAATLDTLERDLTTLTTVLDVQVKGAAATYAVGTGTALAEALAALRVGAVRGVQVRYAYQQEVWWDTLLRTPAGVRLVRMRAPGLG
jgi:hypothetical protein